MTMIMGFDHIINISDGFLLLSIALAADNIQSDHVKRFNILQRQSNPFRSDHINRPNVSHFL